MQRAGARSPQIAQAARPSSAQHQRQRYPNVPRQDSVLYPERRLVADADIFSSIAIERVSQSAQRRCHVHCLSPVSNLRRSLSGFGRLQDPVMSPRHGAESITRDASHTGPRLRHIPVPLPGPGFAAQRRFRAGRCSVCDRSRGLFFRVQGAPVAAQPVAIPPQVDRQAFVFFPHDVGQQQ